MTYSILVRDAETGRFGAAAATGSLCVGGWVLRGDPRAGLSASQGAAPSTFWGDEALSLMRDGATSEAAVSAVTAADPGREARQLAALCAQGSGAAFTGEDNTPARGSVSGEGWIAAGNLLTGTDVLEAVAGAVMAARGNLADRLLAGLRAGAQAGGDSRGLMSAALLILGPDIPPLTLRIDYSDAPLDALEALLIRTRETGYADWLKTVPVLDDPVRRGPTST